MVCKHCSYFITQDAAGVWKAYAKPRQPSLCEVHRDKDGRWLHEPSAHAFPPLAYFLLVLLLTILLIAGIYAFGGLK